MADDAYFLLQNGDVQIFSIHAKSILSEWTRSDAADVSACDLSITFDLTMIDDITYN